jgi:hypothetical protein
MIRPGPDIVEGASRLPQQSGSTSGTGPPVSSATLGTGSATDPASNAGIPADKASLDRCLEKLTDGRARLARMSIGQRVAQRRSRVG